AVDLQRSLLDGTALPTAEDWIFAGTFLSTTRRNPIKDGYKLFTPTGSQRLGPADAVLLSLNAEPQTILRHRRLGYRIHIVRHHQGAGPAIRAWLNSAFEPVRRSIDDIKRDYHEFLTTVSRATGARVFVLNRMSTSGHEDVSNYAPFDAPMSNTLANVASKELNLMLHEIAAGNALDIVDVDALAAELGGAEHLPDGIHQSGLMQMALREELVRLLGDWQREQNPTSADFELDAESI